MISTCLNRNDWSFFRRRRTVSSVLAALGLICGGWTRTHAAEDEHAGHDHVREQRVGGDRHDDHDDHDQDGEGVVHPENGYAGHGDETDIHTEMDEHAGHDHGPGEHVDVDEHAGHDHGDRPDAAVAFSREERRRAGIVIATAGPGDLKTAISLTGEVALNEDRVAHVVPRVGGIARQVMATVGDRVEAGQVLAVLESAELGEAKLDYLSKVNEILCCNLLLPRTRAVYENTLKLLDFLEQAPALDSLKDLEIGEAGDYRAKLISSYTVMTVARQAFAREKALYDKKIASQENYLAAKGHFEQAAAEYAAMRDSVAFEVKQALLEAEAEVREASFSASVARQRLRLMGVDAPAIEELDALVFPAEPCQYPDCTDCAAGMSEAGKQAFFETRFSTFEIRSPQAGVVVERHLTRGENVDGDADVFTVADLRTVWVNLAVHMKDLALLSPGMEATLGAAHSKREGRGRITMISPVVDEATRTATGRVILENGDGTWRPGTFVTGQLHVSASKLPVVVPRQALQMMDGESVVFVPAGDGFNVLAVQTGRMDRDRVEIRSGLDAGTPYVVEGAFEIKAKLVTSNLDPHAGHGH